MEELNEAGLKLFFDEDIYIIKDNSSVEVAKKEEEPASKVEEPAAEPLSLVYMGVNTKGIAIIINDDSNEFLNNSDETLLLNILKAIGFSLEDVAIINHNKSGVEWQEQLEFSKVIVFGILPSTYGMVTENYVIQKKENGSWLFSDSLFSLGSDRVLKGKLWGKLQEFF